MGKFSDCLLFSDMDGTFLDNQGNVHEKNIDAVRYFMREGGLFGLASGRSVPSMRPFLEKIPISAPCIVYNGAAIYDYTQESFIDKMELPKNIKEYLQHILDRFPGLGIECVLADTIYCTHVNEELQWHLDYEYTPNNIGFHVAPMAEIPRDWIKVLLIDEPEKILKVSEYVRTNPFPGISGIMSSPYFLELIPAQATKGTAMRTIANRLGIARENTFGIGDYYNDRDMVENAGIGAFVENAPEDLKKYADILVCHHDEGSVAHFIQKIEARRKRVKAG